MINASFRFEIRKVKTIANINQRLAKSSNPRSKLKHAVKKRRITNAHDFKTIVR